MGYCSNYYERVQFSCNHDCIFRNDELKSEDFLMLLSGAWCHMLHAKTSCKMWYSKHSKVWPRFVVCCYCIEIFNKWSILRTSFVVFITVGSRHSKLNNSIILLIIACLGFRGYSKLPFIRPETSSEYKWRMLEQLCDQTPLNCAWWCRSLAINVNFNRLAHQDSFYCSSTMAVL